MFLLYQLIPNSIKNQQNTNNKGEYANRIILSTLDILQVLPILWVTTHQTPFIPM